MKDEKLPLTGYCKKRSLFERIFMIEPMHNWQTRARNRFGLSTYEVCLKCGDAQMRNGMGKHPSFVPCKRIEEFDNQFDKYGNYKFFK